MGQAATELYGLSRSGREFPVDIALKPVEIDGERFVIGTLRDLTERKRIEREFLVAREIQQSILPKSVPAIPGFDVAARSLPAESTGGEYRVYD